MIKINTVSIVLPVFLLVVFQLITITRSTPLKPTVRSERIFVEYGKWSLARIFSRLPLAHTAFIEISPQQYLFVILDVFMTLMYAVVVYLFWGTISDTSLPIIVFTVLLYSIYPLIAIPEYEDLVRNNVEICSFTVYFFLTVTFSFAIRLIIDNGEIVPIQVSTALDWGLVAIYWGFRDYYLYRILHREILTLDEYKNARETDPVDQAQMTFDEVE